MFPYGNTGWITGHFLTTVDINAINFIVIKFIVRSFIAAVCVYSTHSDTISLKRNLIKY